MSSVTTEGIRVYSCGLQALFALHNIFLLSAATLPTVEQLSAGTLRTGMLLVFASIAPFPLPCLSLLVK